MAFIKVSVLLLLLFVVLVAPIADAEGDLSGASDDSKKRKFFCSTCECEASRYGFKICYRSDRKVGSCPFACGSSCICNKKKPPTCGCTYKVEFCDPPKCMD